MKRLIIVTILALIALGLLYVNRVLNGIDACASRANEDVCVEQYYKNTTWFERWF